VANKFTDAVANLMFVKAPIKAVLTVLAYRTNNKTGACFPSIGRIAAESGFSSAAVKRALRSLRDAGVISKIGEHQTKFGPVNIWQITPVILAPRYEIPQVLLIPGTRETRSGVEDNRHVGISA
jgi:hypothetical protein